ncbi:MAG: hypothetical protein ACLFRW_07655 [Halorhodospira sp.]
MTEVGQQGGGKSDQDSPWKEALEYYLEPAMALLFPQIHAGIDWSQGYRFRDKELQQVVRDAESGRRYADKLVEVYTQEGESTWILLHVEVQGEPESGFAERMYTYHYRLYDRYRREIVSAAVLADTSPSFRPDRHAYERLGCGLQFWFPVAKLLDWEDRWSELEADPNPFASVVLAQLVAKRVSDAHKRKVLKTELTRRLLDQGYSRDDTLQLLRLLDWFLQLPENLEAEYHAELHELEEAYKMPYVTSFERAGEERGLQKGRQEGRREEGSELLLLLLRDKFGSEAAERYRQRVEQADEETIRAWSIRVLRAETIEDIFTDD